MKIVNSTKEVSPYIKNGSCLTIGNFDGVHIGHQVLLKRVRKKAHQKDLTSLVITFDPHPLRVLLGKTPPFITPTKQKLGLLAQQGLDYIVCLPFNREMAELSPEEFVYRYLVQNLKVKEIIIGHDYVFGKGRKGNFDLLKKIGAENNFEAEQIETVYVKGEVVSSTRIRSLIQEGKIWKVKDLLGRYYQITGTIIEGKKRGGPVLGIPTANLKLNDELVPKPGVYAVWAEIEGNFHKAVANVGYNPTFYEQNLSAEVHILNFNQNIYSKTLRVHFVQRIRSEQKFPEISKLLEQIHLDIEQANQILCKPEALPDQFPTIGKSDK